MYHCIICDRTFDYKSLYERHHLKNKVCKEMTNKIIKLTQSLEKGKDKCNKLSQSLEKREEKYYKLKEVSKLILEQNKVLQQEIKQLRQERVKLSHRAEIAEVKYDTYEKASQKCTTNNTIINNNTTIIQDFSIKPVTAFNIDLPELIDVVYNKDILEACKYMLEKYYWTLPPNIRVTDQARKKLFVAKNNQWIQENVKELSHQLFHQSLKPMAYECIKAKINEHEKIYNNPEIMKFPDIREAHFDELLKWDAIKKLWDDFDTPSLQGTLMMSVHNLTNKMNKRIKAGES